MTKDTNRKRKPKPSTKAWANWAGDELDRLNLFAYCKRCGILYLGIMGRTTVHHCAGREVKLENQGAVIVVAGYARRMLDHNGYPIVVSNRKL